MRLGSKITLLTSIPGLISIVVLVLISLYSFRIFSINTARQHAETAAEIILVSLTESMVNGVISKRENLLERLSHIEGLLSVRIIRGENVAKQFGPGMASEASTDEIDELVLRSGEAYFDVLEEGMTPVFRSTIPFTANSRGKPNCLECHQVTDGTVLGAVSLTLTIPDLKRDALSTVGIMIFSLSILALLGVGILRRLMRPLEITAKEVQWAVGRSLEGDFSNRVNCEDKDEIGQIARDLNGLFRFLETGLGQIRNDVAELIQCKPAGKSNLLHNTVNMVEGLINAAQFKQAIEEDESKLEVYNRISWILTHEFRIDRFSIYEVNASKNRMLPMIVNGEETDECHWCDANILVRSETCRARRTGHVIDGIEHPYICTAFHPGRDESNTNHICIPIMQSGTVGGVVQLIARPGEESERYQEQLPFISVYLREAAPVLEAKRLMDTLRESTLRDPMTGLHNRRFLEEYVDTLIAGNNRRKAQLTILMLDLDFFKQVNDQYGHDVGDMVIKALAKCLRNNVRNSDLVIRYGGEEFMIILQDTNSETGVEVAEKIRLAVEALKVEAHSMVLQKTISIGVARFPDDSPTIWQAIKYADVALYKAKERGRNRVVKFDATMWSESEQY